MGDRVADAELFVAVVEASGFSGAARRLGRSQPQVSRRIAALEARLGVRLLERTTRRLRLTDAGERFHAHCKDALAALGAAERAAVAEGGTVRGRLRVSAPPAWARARLAPLLPRLRATCPELDVELVLLERYVDLVDEGFDCVLRLGPLPDSSLASRRVDHGRYVLCAAPDYVARRGTPRRPPDLRRHDCLLLATSPLRARWPLRTRGRVVPVAPRVALATNDAGMLRAAAVAGAGVTLLPDYAVGDDLAAGRLLELMPALRLPAWDVWALAPSRRHLAARVRAFLDLVTAGRAGTRVVSRRDGG